MASVAQGWPVVEMAVYDGRDEGVSYWPHGFWQRKPYYHWDVIYGGYVSHGVLRVVQIGQVYGEPFVNGRPRVERPYQQYFWDLEYLGIRPHWTAIKDRYGILLH